MCASNARKANPGLLRLHQRGTAETAPASAKTEPACESRRQRSVERGRIVEKHEEASGLVALARSNSRDQSRGRSDSLPKCGLADLVAKLINTLEIIEDRFALRVRQRVERLLEIPKERLGLALPVNALESGRFRGPRYTVPGSTPVSVGESAEG